MAVRGINPFEKHVEKIFLALAAAGLTGVVAWQVAGTSNVVEVNRDQVPADQAYEKILSKAKQLNAQMREPNPGTPERLKQPTDPLGEFKKRMAQEVSPSPSLAYAPAGLIGLGTKQATGPRSDQVYLPPKLPAGTRPIAHAFMSTVHEQDVASIEKLAQFMPSSGPYDKAAVTVETTIDPKAIRAALEKDPDGPGPALPLLRAWWANTEVVEVEMVRQELKADGTWGNEVATPLLPGRQNFHDILRDPKIDSQTLGQIVFDASAGMEELLRPEWYRRAELGGNVVGDEWQSPADAIKAAQGGDAAGGPLGDWQRRLKGLRASLAGKERALQNANNQPAPQPSGGGGGGGGSRGPKGAGGGSGGLGGGGGGGGATNQPTSRDRLIKDLERQIEVVKKQITEVEARISELGGKSDPSGTKAPVVRDNDLSVLLSSAEPLAVWHHDIQAVRGATYRYELRVKVNNPLFNRAGQLQADDVAAAQSPTVAIPSGGWTDPIRVDDEVYSFITNASQPPVGLGGGSGLGNAQATLFYYTWGYWRSANVSLEPGDGMVAVWKVPDETKINAGGAEQPAAAPPPVAPRGGGRSPVGGGGAQAPLGGGAAPAAPTNAPLPTKEISKERDAFLLDVIANPLSRGKYSLALIRDVDKTIVAKDPEEQKASDIFKRLLASAAAGHQQLMGAGAPAPANVPGQAPNVPPPLVPNRGGGLGGG